MDSGLRAVRNGVDTYKDNWDERGVGESGGRSVSKSGREQRRRFGDVRDCSGGGVHATDQG